MWWSVTVVTWRVVVVAVAMTFCWIWIGKVAAAWPSERRFGRVYFDLWGGYFPYFPPWVVMMGIRSMIFLMRKWFHASVNRVHLGSILK